MVEQGQDFGSASVNDLARLALLALLLATAIATMVLATLGMVQLARAPTRSTQPQTD